LVASERRLSWSLRFRLVGSSDPLLGLRMFAAPFGDPGERTPRPARQLALAELLRDADRLAEIRLGLVQSPELPLGDPALGDRVAKLPLRSQVLEDGDRAVETRDRLLVPAQVLEDPGPLHRGHRDAELVADLLGERARLVAQLERLLQGGVGLGPRPARTAGPIDRERVERPHARPPVFGIRDLERVAPASASA